MLVSTLGLPALSPALHTGANTQSVCSTNSGVVLTIMLQGWYRHAWQGDKGVREFARHCTWNEFLDIGAGCCSTHPPMSSKRALSIHTTRMRVFPGINGPLIVFAPKEHRE